MTTAALILAMLPLAARLGDGGEWRAPMAVCVIGGLLSSTFLTLLVIPSVYTLVDDAQAFLASLPGRVRRLARRRVWRRRATSCPAPRPPRGWSPAPPMTNERSVHNEHDAVAGGVS